MSPEIVNFLISLLPQLLRITRHLMSRRGCPLIATENLRNMPNGYPLVAVAKLRNLCSMFPTHLLGCLSPQRRKFLNGSEILWQKLIPPFHKRTSPYITQFFSLICISVVLHHLQAMTSCTMTRLSALIHKLDARTLLILKLLAQVAVMCKVVSSYKQRSRMVKIQSIPLKTLSFHSCSILDP